MAITASTLASLDSTANASSHTFVADFSPAANRILLLIACVSDETTVPAAPTISTTLSGVTFTPIESVNITISGNVRKILTFWWAASGAAPGTGNITFTHAATREGINTTCIEINGANLITPIVQDGENSNGNSSTPDVALASFGDAVNNAFFAAVGWNADVDEFTPDGTVTTYFNAGHPTPNTHMHVWGAVGEDTSPSGTLGQARSWGAIAIEVAAAQAGGGITVDAIPKKLLRPLTAISSLARIN